MLTCNLKKKKDFYTPYLSIYTLLVILWLIIMILLDWLLFDVSLFYRILFTLCCILSIIMEASFYVFYKHTTSPWPKKVLITSVCILAIDSLLVIILLCQRFLYAVALTPIGLIHLMHFLILTARIKPINKR